MRAFDQIALFIDTAQAKQKKHLLQYLVHFRLILL